MLGVYQTASVTYEISLCVQSTRVDGGRTLSRVAYQS